MGADFLAAAESVAMMRRFFAAVAVVLALEAMGFVGGFGAAQLKPPHAAAPTAAELTQCGAPRWVVMSSDGRPIILAWHELRAQPSFVRRYGAADVVRREIGCGAAR